MPVDLLNPLATLQWEKKEFEGIWPTIYTHDFMSMSTALLFKGRLMVMITFYNNQLSSLCEYSCDSSSWKMLPPLPCNSPGLSTYHFQLVLVGGYLPNDRDTNQVWVSGDDGYSWSPSLPPMLKERSFPTVVNTGTPEYLLVTDGCAESYFDGAVEVLIGEQWWTAVSAPHFSIKHFSIKHHFSPWSSSAIHRGILYLSISGSSYSAL